VHRLQTDTTNVREGTHTATGRLRTGVSAAINLLKDEKMAPRCLSRRVVLHFLALALLLHICRPSAKAGQDKVSAHSRGPAETGLMRLTLAEAQELALRNNKALTLARLNVQEKGHATDAARKDYFPKVIGIDSYFHFNDNLGSVLTFSRGQRGILPPGSRIIEATVLNEDTNLATIMVAQPITKLIAVNAAVQLARAEQCAAQAQLDKGTRDLVSGVAQAYYGLLGAQRIQAALELQAGMLDQLLHTRPVPELRIALLEVRQGLVQARSQVQDLTHTLNDLLDLPPGTVLELIDPVPGELPVRAADEAAQLALACNPEVRAARQDIAKAEAAMKIARMAYLPDVSVMGGYANQTGADYVQPNIGYVGVMGTYTFFEWGKKHDIKRQRDLDIALAHQNLAVVTDKVQLDARKAYEAYAQARETYRLAGEMVDARKEAAKAASGPAAMQAQADAAKAELDRMKAEIDYRVAHAKLAGLINAQQ
jgi:outer membrane protein TolC